MEDKPWSMEWEGQGRSLEHAREKHFAYFYKYLSGPGAKQNLIAGLGEMCDGRVRSAGRENPPRASF
jgi:hypothetical protein